ncbi:DUF2155 domain-containing protein [Sabulicella rubraurantiaca]|uniref:DUF2155 domain-containing protein n=1 Tax=Sabulicella rubraurantiaca TaxID=2811429 RepID=UPI001A97B827|nr:DUF2155 domain-containing protein [Sabulicella rubraurantiaca]
MKRILLLLALLLALPAGAQEWVQRRTAEIQALDKVNARVTVLTARVNEPVPFGTLTILVRSCQGRPADEVPDAAAWMEITDKRSGNESIPVFRGWMFAENPALNMLEHPVYDIRILSCR